MSAAASGRRLGILFHGSKIWISELASIVFVAALSIVLLVLSGSIIRNEYTIHRTTCTIATGKSDRIILAHYLEELRRRVAIAELLCSIAGRNLSAGLLLELSDIVVTNSIQFGYDPLLLLAVIEVESFYLPTARGKYRSGAESGALGLMQLKPRTAREVAAQLEMDSLSQDDLFKPEINVILGVAYLTSMISRFQSFKLGLLAYNQGPAVVSRHLSENLPLSVEYYRKVLRSYYALQKRSMRLAAAGGKTPICR
ncbi:MAG: lytic transglycosylase domain-containing protein [Chitinispirillaceae bacterium]|nr:lytic transglycosylase domain-containing protein [Chitinispirillaceae bacterium]